MTYEITAPTKGQVTLSLDWEDAEILARLVGRCNSGNLQKFSPALYDFVQDMVEHVGRDSAEAANIVTEVQHAQVYLVDLR